VGLLPDASADASLTHVPLYGETLCAVVARHHPLAGAVAVDAAALQDLSWIVPTPESAASRSAQLFFEAVGLQMPVRAVESVSILTNLGLLMESPMVALMPHVVAEQFVRAGLLSVLPLGAASAFGKVGYTLCADRVPSAAAQRLVLALQEVGAGLVQGEAWRSMYSRGL
jgi:DNA-binding transcriptional LysR family regulator